MRARERQGWRLAQEVLDAVVSAVDLMVSPLCADRTGGSNPLNRLSVCVCLPRAAGTASFEPWILSTSKGLHSRTPRASSPPRGGQGKGETPPPWR